MRVAIALLVLVACRPAPSSTTPAPNQPTATTSETSVATNEPAKSEEPKGALDKDIIRRVVRSHIQEIVACYNQGLGRDGSMKGRVMIEFTIGPTGTISAANIKSNELGDAEVAECIRKAVATWVFPPPVGGGNVVVAYPFLLQR
jgi:TonB family protein